MNSDPVRGQGTVLLRLREFAKRSVVIFASFLLSTSQPGAIHT
jgi:hypothetical protein